MKTTGPSEQSPTRRRKILIVDDHPVIREGLSAAINQEADFTVCATAPNVAQALAAVKATPPDAMIVDLSLEGQSGLALIKEIKAQSPALPILALSMYDEGLYAERVLRAGGQGYLMKREPIETVVLALRRILQGEIYLSDKMKGQLVRNFSGQRAASTPTVTGLLSDRELEVFHLIGQGLGTSQMAERLSLSMKTISSYRQNIKLKLKLNTGNDVVRYAVEWARLNCLE